jgi:two-component system chemotaxis response regulator CheB
MFANRPIPKVPTPTSSPVRQDRVDVIVIGASTGGPDALSSIVGALRADISVPILVVQHMPPLFTRLFAARLDRTSALHVAEAVDGQLVQPGHILVAPGDQHLTVRRQGTDIRVRLTQDPPENYCRPSVDVLFRSAAAVYGAGVVACVLTGMGRDGAKGAERVRAAGGRIIVQDEASSVVWGMPGAVVTAGVATDVVPLHQIADRLQGALGNRRLAARPVLPASSPRAVALGGAS